MIVHAMARSGRLIVERTRGRGAKRVHKTRCGVPLIELAVGEYSINDDEVTCERCLDLNRPPAQDEPSENQ